MKEREGDGAASTLFGCELSLKARAEDEQEPNEVCLSDGNGKEAKLRSVSRVQSSLCLFTIALRM